MSGLVRAAPGSGAGRLPAPALLLEGAIFRAVRGLVDRGTRQAFSKTTGTWPGEERPDPA